MTTADDFLNELKRSELPTEAEWQALTSVESVRKAENAESLSELLIDAGWTTKFQSKRLLSGKSRGLVCEPYEVLDLIGKGGMGHVFIAWDRVKLRFAAVKMLSDEQQRNERGMLRFEREVELNRRLEHPKLARGYEAGHWKKTPFLAMEYVPGPTFYQLVRRHGPLDVPWVLAWVADVADALDYIHLNGVVHRDMKPSNVIVSPDGSATVLDLGLARVFDDDHNEEKVLGVKRVVGSFDYIAPEQTMNSSRVDARADVYSLGCVLYFLLSGRPPFDHAIDRKAKIAAHRNEAPLRLSTGRPGLPKGLDQLASRLLSKQPAQRCTVAAEVRDELRDWVDRLTGGEPLSDLPSGWFSDLPAPPRRTVPLGSDASRNFSGSGFWKRLGQGLQRFVRRKDQAP